MFCLAATYLAELAELHYWSQQNVDWSLTTSATLYQRVRSHLNHPSTPTGLDVGEEGVRQPDHLAHPVEHDGLQLCARGRGGPREADAADGVAQHVTEDGGVRVAGREVGVEARMLPVCDLAGWRVEIKVKAEEHLLLDFPLPCLEEENSLYCVRITRS